MTATQNVPELWMVSKCAERTLNLLEHEFMRLEETLTNAFFQDTVLAILLRFDAIYPRVAKGKPTLSDIVHSLKVPLPTYSDSGFAWIGNLFPVTSLFDHFPSEKELRGAIDKYSEHYDY